MQQSQKKGNFQDKSKGTKKAGLIAICLVIAALSYGFWHKTNETKVTEIPNLHQPVISQQQNKFKTELPGVIKKQDLSGILNRFKNAKPGSDEQKAYLEAENYISEKAQTRITLDRAIRETSGPILVIADTSGSMESDIAKVATTNLYLSGLSASRPVTVIYVDSEVRGYEQLSPGQAGSAIGGGSTSFKPGFEFLQAQGAMPGLVVYVTDGECSYFPADPGYPVLWMLVRPSQLFTPPFGVVAGN